MKLRKCLGKDVVRITTDIDPDLHLQLKIICAKTRRTLRDITLEAIALYIAENDQKNLRK